MHQRLYLIGFMGSGKSHTGRWLASRLNYTFLDLDELLEARAGKTIAELFAQEGEARFRALEAEALRDTRHWLRLVVACGGGTPCHADNMAWMNTHGLTLYLEVPAAVLVKRLATGVDHRPLLKGLDLESLPAFIERRLAERAPFYQQAAITLRVNDERESADEIFARHWERITGH
jgi:shikimate kinase